MIEHLLDCLAASYRLDLEGGPYVRNLVDTAAPVLDAGLGVMAYTYATRRSSAVVEQFATSSRFDRRWLPGYYEAVDASGLEVKSSRSPTGFQAWGHMPCGQASKIPAMRPYLPLFSHVGGAQDVFAVNALDASGRGLWIGVPLPSTKRIAPAQTTLFTRFAAHLTAAIRVRRETPRVAARLSAGGKLLHAEPAPDQKEGVVAAREELREATLAFEQARTKKMRSDVEGATRRWRPLVVARWSLLDEFDSDGKRFVVAVENAPPTRTPRRDLSEREHQIMTQAHLGHSDKVIAYELGLSVSTVRVLIHRAAKKLGATTRKEALERFAARAFT